MSGFRSEVRDLEVRSYYRWILLGDDPRFHEGMRVSKPDNKNGWHEVRVVVAHWRNFKGDVALQFELPPDWDDTVAMNAALMQIESSLQF